MKFTIEEYKDILIPNGKKIIDFIEKEIQPYVYEEIAIPFGDTIRRGRMGDVIEKEFTLYVKRNEIYGSCGGLGLAVNPEDESTYRKYIFRDYNYGGRFIFSLCDEWAQIKKAMVNSVYKVRESRERALKEFKI